MSHFNPYSSTQTARPCWQCVHFDRIDSSGCHAVCMAGGRVHVHTDPTTGCAFWIRMPGADSAGRPPTDYKVAEDGVGWRDIIPPHLLW